MIKKIFLIIAFLSLNACVPGYHRGNAPNQSGYSEIKLSDNNFKVVYQGTSRMSIEEVRDYLLLRSAEVAIQNNFKYFQIEESGAFGRKITENYCSGYFVSSKVYVPTCSSSTYTIPSAYHLISCFNGKPKKPWDFVYDAQIIIDQIRPKYHIKPTTKDIKI